MLSVHGLIRANAPELGRDADTGGQVLYVLDLAKALSCHPQVEKVDLVTRLVEDPEVSSDYACPEEEIAPRARLLRLPFGPRRYIRKELLWEYLDQLVDRVLHLVREGGRIPDLIHSHYADAGYCGVQMSRMLGVPLAHTGHSLGRVKRKRLLESGQKASFLDRKFHFPKRIAAEEAVLQEADLVVTSTRQEIEEQYALYQHFDRKRAAVIPPGTDASRFSPPRRGKVDAQAKEKIERFFSKPAKPLVLAIARPDAKKNLEGLMEAFGRHPRLREAANLAIVAGNREDIALLGEGAREVLFGLLSALDRLDLWGSVALPKAHAREEVPGFYRLAAFRRGVFVNPAFNEPFGLTLIEAAASGLPVVATEDGGPKDILANCRNGTLVNPRDNDALGEAIFSALSDADRWRRWQKNGLRGVAQHYVWEAHVERYLKHARRVLARQKKSMRRLAANLLRTPSMFFPRTRATLVAELEGALLGDLEALPEFVSWLKAHSREIGFVLVSSRSHDRVWRVLRRVRMPAPDVLIGADGTEIAYGPDFRLDHAWGEFLRADWRKEAVVAALSGLAGLCPRAMGDTALRAAFRVDPERFRGLAAAEKALAAAKVKATLLWDKERYFAALPKRASPGKALRWLSMRWGTPMNRFVVAATRSVNRDLLMGDVLGVVPKGASRAFSGLRGNERLYFACLPATSGVLEGMRHYLEEGKEENHAARH